MDQQNLILKLQVRVIEKKKKGQQYLFEIYAESGFVKSTQRDSKGTIIQGDHEKYR